MIDDHRPASDRPIEATADSGGHRQERVDDAALLKDCLQQLRGAKSEFVAAASRELRTPLALLLGPLQDILDSPASALVPASRTMLEGARQRALTLLRLLDTLPGWSTIDAATERDGAAGVFMPVDLGAYTAALAEHFRPACQAAGLRLVVDCPAVADMSLVDRDAWEKIVVYLLANAFNATGEGSIEVRLRIDGGNAHLTVGDNGTGIAARELPYVFDRVGQLAAVGVDDPVRHRFGLPLVRDLVRLLSGTIEVQSTTGRGTTFTVLVPLEARDRVA